MQKCNASKLSLSELKFLNLSSNDPVGQVFFYNGRVLRGISKEFANYIKTFLSSKLYAELRESEIVVDMWVVDDIKIADYEIIVESERVDFVPWRYWSVAQMQDAAIRTIQLFDKCQEYSYYLKDANLDNFGLKNGKLIFLDLGSFVDKKDDFFFESFAINIYSKLAYALRGEVYLARHIGSTHAGTNPYTPSIPVEQSEMQKKVLHRMVKYYDCYLKSNWSHMRLRTLGTMCFIQLFNKLFKKYRNGNDLIKYKSVYKHPTISDIYNLQNIYQDVKTICEETFENIELQKYADVQSVLIYGNINPAMVNSLLDKGINITIGSNDIIYTNWLYEYAQCNNANINVVLFNPIIEKEEYEMKVLKQDLAIISSTRYKDIKMNRNDDWCISRMHNLCNEMIFI